MPLDYCTELKINRTEQAYSGGPNRPEIVWEENIVRICVFWIPHLCFKSSYGLREICKQLYNMLIECDQTVESIIAPSFNFVQLGLRIGLTERVQSPKTVACTVESCLCWDVKITILTVHKANCILFGLLWQI